MGVGVIFEEPRFVDLDYFCFTIFFVGAVFLFRLHLYFTLALRESLLDVK